MTIWHLGFSSSKRGTLYPDEGQRRRAVLALVRAAGQHLVLFSLANEHKHTMVRTEGSIKKLGGDIRRALSAVSEEPLGEPWTDRVDGTKRKAGLLRYFLQQPSHHDIGVHDALWTGSCFLDLAGARVIDALRLQIWDVLPGVRRSVIYEHVGLPAYGVEPLTLAELRVIGAVRLVAAASAALAADPLLRGKGRLERRGRNLALKLGRAAGIAAEELRWALALPRRSYHRALDQPEDSRGMLAVRTRLALEEAAIKAARCIPGTELGRRLGLCG